jgi:hypothetical protein
MELTADNVEQVFVNCLFRTDEDPSKKISIEGVNTHVSFNVDKLELHKQDIESMLLNVHPSFMCNGPDKGWCFANFCLDKHEQLWTGLHVVADYLLCMGLAIKKVQFLTPRYVWADMGIMGCYLQVLN